MELSDEGVYVWFKRGSKAAKTVVRSRWPFVAVDVDEAGDVIGIEITPAPAEITLGRVAKLANVSIPKPVISSARYMRSEAVPA